MEHIKLKNENELELTVTDEEQSDYIPIFGGMDLSPDWEEYLEDIKDDYKQHFELIKKAIEELGWVGVKADSKANDTYFKFSDRITIGFSWRAWGDLMSAIVGKGEGYMAYYC